MILLWMLLKKGNKQLIDNIKLIKEGLQEQEIIIREAIIKQYEKTQEKIQDFGLSVRVRNVMEYDNDEALAWAKSNDKCLMLNKKEFEAIAKTDMTLGFIEMKEVPSAVIPTKIKVN